jgi:hypothetical protein
LDAHLKGEEQIGGAGREANGGDAEVLQQASGVVGIAGGIGNGSGFVG